MNKGNRIHIKKEKSINWEEIKLKGLDLQVKNELYIYF